MLGEFMQPLPPDPMELFVRWLAEAQAHEPRVATAMQLATVSGTTGHPSIRTVLLKGWGSEGLLFYTNLESRKAAELSQVPEAALCFHWKSLERQILVEGRVERVSDDDADGYFATRPRGSQLGAWASQQSRPRQDGELEGRLAEVTARFQGGQVPRPPFWGGYCLVPSRYEFWQGSADRLHDRQVYQRDEVGWRRSRQDP
jgi:pyridoxamine 5'-phosphate oxidase